MREVFFKQGAQIDVVLPRSYYRVGGVGHSSRGTAR